MHAALLTTVLFAITAVCATKAAECFGSNTANLARLSLALLVLGSWHGLFGSPVPGPGAGWFVVAGAIGFGFGGFCMFQAFPRIGSTLSLLVVESAAAVFATLLGWFWLQAPLTSAQLLFASLSLAGVWLGLWPRALPASSRRTLWVGATFAAVAAVGQGLSFAMSKHAFQVLELASAAVSPMSAAAYRLFGGASVALFVFAIAWSIRRTGGVSKRDRPRSWQVRHLGWIAANALAGPVLGVTCMLWAIREVGNPGLVQAVVATATLISVPLSRIVEVRHLRWNYYLGALISLLGTAGLLMNVTRG